MKIGYSEYFSVPWCIFFCYDGDKIWLIYRMRQWILKYGSLNKELIESFVGGGIVNLTAAFEGLVGQVT